MFNFAKCINVLLLSYAYNISIKVWKSVDVVVSTLMKMQHVWIVRLDIKQLHRVDVWLAKKQNISVFV